MANDPHQTDNSFTKGTRGVEAETGEPAKGDASATGGASAQPGQKDASGEDGRLQALHAVPVDLQVVLGHASLPVAQLLKLSRGAVVEIDRKVGESVDIHVNSHLVARGEVVILDDNKLGITLTDIAGAQSLAGLPGRVA